MKSTINYNFMHINMMKKYILNVSQSFYSLTLKIETMIKNSGWREYYTLDLFVFERFIF